MKTYKAPWGKLLIVSSVLVTLLCVGASVGTPLMLGKLVTPSITAASWLPLVVIVGCLPFVVRSYTITEDAILIRRLFWDTRLERVGLKSAEIQPDAMKRSIRTCGNGGGYSITGWYWSKSLGFYRAYVTDLKRTVVLRYSMRTVVLSPDEPEDFVARLGFATRAADGVTLSR